MVRQKPFEYLSSLQGMGIHMDLSAIRQVLEKMKNPQDSYPSVLVGGTNGKGSICAMTSSILLAAGLKVGLYTSPHLLDVRERICFNGKTISRSEMAACIAEVQEYAENTLTYFEFLTVVAFHFFLKKKIDVAVLEVGMGGRLDATNMVLPVVSAISNISVEHSAYLGTRLSQIAGEKAGIIKEGGICITSATQKPVTVVLENVCRQRKATLYRIGSDIKMHAASTGMTFSYRGLEKKYQKLSCPLLGKHQIRNAAVAIGITEILARRGFAINDNAVYHGLASTVWEGRLEILHELPRIVVDGAHNPAGIAVLCEALKSFFSYRKLIVILGVLRDKNVHDMVKRIARMADVMVLTRPVSDRALVPSEMARTAMRYGRAVIIEDDPPAALKRSLEMAGPDDLICVTGSLYLVGQVKKMAGDLIK